MYMCVYLTNSESYYKLQINRIAKSLYARDTNAILKMNNGTWFRIHENLHDFRIIRSSIFASSFDYKYRLTKCIDFRKIAQHSILPKITLYTNVEVLVHSVYVYVCVFNRSLFFTVFLNSYFLLTSVIFLVGSVYRLTHLFTASAQLASSSSSFSPSASSLSPLSCSCSLDNVADGVCGMLLRDLNSAKKSFSCW